MDQQQIKRLESSFNLLAPRVQELMDRFFATLFTEHRAVRSMFPRDMSRLKEKLIASLMSMMKNLRTPEKMHHPLLDLGQRHVEFGVEQEQYVVFRDTLIATMGEVTGDAWDEQWSSDWTSMLDFVWSVMLQGADQPGSMRAEVA